MSIQQFIVIVLGLAVVLSAAGCVSSADRTITYDTEITSTPPNAAVHTDDAEARPLGHTPLFVDGELEVEQRRSWLSNTITGFGAFMVAGFGFAGVAELRREPIEFEHLEPDEPSKGWATAMFITAVATGYLFHKLSRIGDNMVISSSTPGIDSDIKVGKRFRSPSDEDFINEMPSNRYRLSAPGYADIPVRAKAGDRLSVDLPVMGEQPAAVADAESSTSAAPVSAPESSPHVTGSPQPNAYALVVGIEDYRNVTPTPGARGDAEKFAEMLRTTLGVPSSNIHLLTDENATRGDVLSMLSWLQNNVPSDGRIYFFFSGHGAPDVETGASYMLPYEGQPETLEFTGLPMDDILDQLEQTPARDVLAFVDACFSGSGERSALPEGTRPLVPVQETTTESAVALFSSSSATEISGNAPDTEEGLFTRHLIRAIAEGRADIDGDGQISLAELEQYVAPRVAREAQRANRDQTPNLNVSDQLGDPSNIILLWGLPRD